MNEFSRRIKNSSKKSKIILANDIEYSSIDKLERQTITNIKKLHDYLCAIKLNFHLILPLGKDNLIKINRAAHDANLQTIADIKLNDIGNTNQAALKWLWQCGFDAVIVNPIMGRENLKDLVKLAHRTGHGIITLVHMSHPDARLGYGLSVRNPKTNKIQKIHDLFLEWSIQSDVDGVVIGATIPEIISRSKKVIKKRCGIYSPGVGTQGGDPKKALGAGSDYLIVGRTILNSTNPTLEAQRLLKLCLKS